MFVCCECCVLSGRGLGDGLITRPEESYRLWCVFVCDQETSKTRRLKLRYWAVKNTTKRIATPGKQTSPSKASDFLLFISWHEQYQHDGLSNFWGASDNVTSGSRRDVDEKCAFLDYNAAYSGNSSPTFRDKKAKKIGFLDPSSKGPAGRSETSTVNQPPVQ